MYWESATKEGVKRKPLLIPQKYFILCKVFSWSSIFRERFERCLVWYLKPQQIKKDLLVSQMPRTQDLQPFLIVFSINIKGHINNMMWSQGLEFKKQLLASGDNSSINVCW